MQNTLKSIIDDHQHIDCNNLWILTDSQSVLSKLERGPGNQCDVVLDNVWNMLMCLNDKLNAITLQCIPSHKGIKYNEEADTLAAEASDMTKDEIPITLVQEFYTTQYLYDLYDFGKFV